MSAISADATGDYMPRLIFTNPQRAVSRKVLGETQGKGSEMIKTPRVLNRYHTKTTPDGAVYVGRPSKWGNPFRIGVDGTREEVVDKYRQMLATNPDLTWEARQELRGKNLVCWCAPLPCHADVLLEVANEYEQVA